MQTNARSFSTPLLYVAWSCFLLSLVAPATQEPFMFFPAKHMPVAVMLAVSALSAFAPLETNGDAILIFAAVMCFLASPVFVNARRGTFRRLLALPALAGALLAWVPLLVPTGHDELIQRGSVMWGYYLFGMALTLSSAGWVIALFQSPALRGSNGRRSDKPELAPWSIGVAETSTKRGFPVVVPGEKAEPPRSG